MQVRLRFVEDATLCGALQACQLTLAIFKKQPWERNPAIAVQQLSSTCLHLRGAALYMLRGARPTDMFSWYTLVLSALSVLAI